ncbi:class I SAM-dependent methyltransferase [Ammoniphilus resinae]|uniref:Ubiquinone/menaquinone biosynthesis C-methylase UbiE n=1 Tax=Ammoniphilus resinae TaxID=861532 RepID=A0ABS4GLY0_9BACL|nr:class I SAM-dependent methyltransferase [Ammoniphilus resinae]MBP1931273.1 ubiquinone/menaquinone biosynthesis C-methylase UbiE [Ammoniphilus resinae]
MESHNFNELFDQWAKEYDQTVYDQHGEYNEVFEDYEVILQQVIDGLPAAPATILEFGVGTGNLSTKLIQAGYKVIGVEPSEEMRKKVEEKGLQLDLRDGTFLNIPLAAQERVDGIVSTYAFHHLTLPEKEQAITLMKSFLNPRGRIVFADTAYENAEAKEALFKRVEMQGKMNLMYDLNSEYYELITDLKEIYEKNGFVVDFVPLNRYVWLSSAKI